MKPRTKLKPLSALPGRELDPEELLLVAGAECGGLSGTDCTTRRQTGGADGGAPDSAPDHDYDAMGGGGYCTMM